MYVTMTKEEVLLACQEWVKKTHGLEIKGLRAVAADTPTISVRNVLVQGEVVRELETQGPYRTPGGVGTDP